MTHRRQLEMRQDRFDPWGDLRAVESACPRPRSRFKSIALVLALIAAASTARAQQPSSDQILGFETPSAWAATGNAAAGTTLSATTTRTQGNFALALSNPADLERLTSLPVGSDAKALAGIANSGAIFEVDVMLPGQVGNPVRQGLLELFVSSPSRGVQQALVGLVNFAGLRPGIYTTMKFPISDDIGNALGGAAFSDLVFQFQLSSPGTGAGTYLFDNLRVHSIAPPAATPPPGYGTSVDLVVFGNAPVAQLFPVGIVQVPDSFHLKLGTTGATTVQLALGFDGTPSFTCTYVADPSDPAGKSYTVTSCTGGMQPGDLVGADWVSLGIVGGNATMKLRAQLAGNPVGDLAGPGIIPAMPTFWGDFDGCVPAPVPGAVVTTSTSCAAQTAEAGKIVTDYFNKVQNSNPPNDWIVTPTPEFAARHGDGSPNNNLLGPPPAPNDPPLPFDEEGHLNQGGSWDAYYDLGGTLDPEFVTGTDANKTHFGANLSAHVVLWGNDVDVARLQATADSFSGETTPTFMPATYSGKFDLFLFQQEVISPTGFPFDPSKGTSLVQADTGSYDLPPIQIWVFTINFGVETDIELDGAVGAAPTGADIQFTPTAAIKAKVSGGVNIAFVSGQVTAKVDLFSISTPVTTLAKFNLDTSPAACSMTLAGTFNGQLTIASLGGEVDLVITVGSCPFCFNESWTLFKWQPLDSKTWTLFDLSGNLSGASELPTSLCTIPLKVTMTAPTNGATFTQNIPAGFPAFEGQATLNGVSIPCSDLTWSFSSTSGTLSPITGCAPTVTFPTAGSWTVSLSATETFTDQFGTQISDTGKATPVNVTVSSLASGVYITEIVDPFGNPYTPSGGVITVSTLGPYTIHGLVVGATGTLSSSFSVPCGTLSNLMNGSSTTPTVTWTASGCSLATNLTTTMTTTANGSPFGTATATVDLAIIF